MGVWCRDSYRIKKTVLIRDPFFCVRKDRPHAVVGTVPTTV